MKYQHGWPSLIEDQAKIAGSFLILPIFRKEGVERIGGLEKVEVKLPKGKQFTEVKVTGCIRCGACMRVCCHKLSPILIKEAFDKQKVEKLIKLKPDLCDGCGHCNFVCPARIDLRGSILRAKAFLKG